MNNINIGILISLICVVLTFSLSVKAEMSADEIASLGVDLTPLGGEKAGMERFQHGMAE